MTQYTTVVLLITTCLIQEILTEYCGDNIFCHPPYKCCQVKKGNCCYDSMLHTNRHLRLQIWNMWYFWFLVIFMVMSCFGGCGYYRHRRFAMLGGRATSNVTRPVTVSTARQRPTHRNHSDRMMNRACVNMYGYSGPGVNVTLPVTHLPPAYSEVVSQPGLYPVNKTELPPYPGLKPEDCVEGDSAVGQLRPNSSDTSLPPPYSEHPRRDEATPTQNTNTYPLDESRAAQSTLTTWNRDEGNFGNTRTQCQT